MMPIIKKMLLKFYSFSPYPELLIRRIYWHPILHKMLSNYKKRFRKSNRQKPILPDIREQKINTKLLAEGLQSLKINNGDILLVHSSMDGLKNTGLSPTKVISILRDIVGIDGTIVMPAFQKFECPCPEGKLIEHKENFSDEVFVYNYRGVACWTGMLNSIFLMQPDTLRSYFPNNSLAAQGPHAKPMMENNLKGDLPHGRFSAWKYCVEHHAKVLFLGLKADHCFTLIHTVEDILDDEWPVNDWYKKQKYKIIDGVEETNIIVRERRLKWARYITEKYGTNQIRKAGLLKTHMFGGVTVEYIDDAYKFFEYLKNETIQNGPLFYKILNKYLKR